MGQRNSAIADIFLLHLQRSRPRGRSGAVGAVDRHAAITKAP